MSGSGDNISTSQPLFTIGSKRSKSSTGQRWTALEKSTLIELVEAQKHVIESKKTDFGTTSRKSSTWEDIAKQFASTVGCTPRSVKQLKNWWKNAKQRAKNEVRDAKRSSRKTGGGPPESTLSEEAQRVAGVCPTQMESLKNPYDCDGDEESEELLDATPPQSPKATNPQQPPESLNQCDDSDNVDEAPPEKRFKTPSRAAQLKEARHAFVEMEQAEHQIRLDTLRVENDIAKASLEKIRLEISLIREEYEAKMKLHHAKLESFLRVPQSNSWRSNESYHSATSESPSFQPTPNYFHL